jgi:hypothetical protein
VKKTISIEKCRAKDLAIDPSVQRAEEVSHVNRLSREWRNEYVGVLIGSRRSDGRVYLLDGFQRLLAVRDRQGKGDYSFTVEVHNGLTIREEAEIFLAHNKGRKAVSPYAKFRVSLTAGDPVAVAINETVESLGLSVGPRSTQYAIGSVALLERIVGQMGRNIDEQKLVLHWVLKTYQDVYGSTQDHWRNEILEGLAMFRKKHGDNPHLNDQSLKRVLSKVTIPQLIAAAKAKSLGSNRVSAQVAEVIEELYDRGKSTRRLVVVS